MKAIRDNLFEALSNEQRRWILFALAERADPIVMDSPPDALDGGHDARAERRHVHLPKLVDYGFVDWDQRSATVARGPRFEEIEPVVRLLADHRESFPSPLV